MDKNTRNLIDKAIVWHDKGFCVSPAVLFNGGKRPSRGKTPAKWSNLEYWFGEDDQPIHPEDRPDWHWQGAEFLAILPSGSGRIICIDEDEAGLPGGLHRWLTRYPEAGLTLQTMSQSGRGKHLYYRLPEGSRQRKAIKGKGFDGLDFICGMNIVFETGDIFLDEDILPWPHKEVIEPGSKKERDGDREYSYDQHTQEGGRNDHLYRMGIGWGADNPDSTAAQLLEAMRMFSAVQMRPPMDDDEIMAVCDSVQRSKVWRERGERQGPVNVPDSFPLFNEIDFPPPPSPLIGNWLFPGTLNVIYARSGVGKTGLMVDLFQRIRKGSSFAQFTCEANPDAKMLWVNGDLPPPIAGLQLDQYLRDLNVHFYDAYQQNLFDIWDALLPKFAGFDHIAFDTRSSLFRQKDMMDFQETDELHMRLQELAAKGPVVWLIAHSAKPNQNTVAQSIFGPSSAEWWVDNIIGMETPTKTDYGEGSKAELPIFKAFKSEDLPREAAFWVRHEKAKWQASFRPLAGTFETAKNAHGYPTGRRLRLVQNPEK